MQVVAHGLRAEPLCVLYLCDPIAFLNLLSAHAHGTTECQVHARAGVPSTVLTSLTLLGNMTQIYHKHISAIKCKSDLDPWYMIQVHESVCQAYSALCAT